MLVNAWPVELQQGLEVTYVSSGGHETALERVLGGGAPMADGGSLARRSAGAAPRQGCVSLIGGEK
jgi:hypothetical protein